MDGGVNCDTNCDTNHSIKRIIFTVSKRTARRRQARSRGRAAALPSASRTFHLPRPETLSPGSTDSPPPAPPLAPTVYSLALWTGLLWGPPVRGVTRDASVCVWLLSPRTVASGSVHVVAGGRTSFLPGAGSHSSMWVDTPCLSFIHGGTLGCFHLSAVVNHAAVNAGVQVSVSAPAFHSPGARPGSESPVAR